MYLLHELEFALCLNRQLIIVFIVLSLSLRVMIRLGNARIEKVFSGPDVEFRLLLHVQLVWGETGELEVFSVQGLLLGYFKLIAIDGRVVRVDLASQELVIGIKRHNIFQTDQTTTSFFLFTLEHGLFEDARYLRIS